MTRSLALPFVALGFFANIVSADLLYYDGFDQEPGVGTPSGWIEGDHQGTYLGLGVSSGSLTYPNFAVSGNKWELDDPRGNATLIFSETGLQSGETLFFSFLLQVDELGGLSSSPSGIINLRFPGGAGHEVIGSIGFGRETLDDQPIGYRLSFHGEHRGFSHDASVVSPEFYTEGQTLLIVGSYARVSGGNNVKFWVNPDPDSLGQLIPPEADYSLTGNTGRAVDRLVIASTSSGALPGSYFLDEFRFGTTWADVTPVPEPSTYALLVGVGAIGFVVRLRRGKKE